MQLNEWLELYTAVIDTAILVVLIVEYQYDTQVYDKVLVKVASASQRGKRGKKTEKVKTITVGGVAEEKLG